MGTVLARMGLLSVLVLLSATACAAVHVHAELQVSEVKVSWLTKLSMEIEIGRNQTDTILLTPASNIPGMATPCLFSGQLLRDPRSVVAVSGCLGDEVTSLSIASTLLPGGIVDISLVDGVAYQVTADEAIDVEDYVVPPQGRRKREVEESSPRPRSRTRSRTRDRSRSDDYEDYDYEVDDFVIPPQTRHRVGARVFSGSLPKNVVLETDIKYDNSLLLHFENSHPKTKEWISRVVELSKPRMSHISLAMPITLKTRKIDHTDRSLKASKKDYVDLVIYDSPSSLTSYFCEDILVETKLRGYAGDGSACRTDGYGVNINELFTTSNSELRTARNFAHELGHNLGMKHDFADDHGGRVGPCNKEGLMSYGKDRPNKWSECSDKDFTEWWTREGHHCVKETSESISDCICGLAQRETRIVGGQETEVNEYPWQVALVRKGTSVPNRGGSLISNQWILTARHCTTNPVYVAQALHGEHDVKNQEETSVVRENIIQWVNHPKYDPNTLDHDFSLLKMENPIDFLSHPHIRPICLPENDDKTYKEYVATAIGWGRVTYFGATSNVLMEVDVNVLSNDECGTNYIYSPEEITERMLCANVEGGGKDACQGDSGGPLFTAFGDGMTPGQNIEVIGVVSWGNGCAEADSPGVYSRVSNQLDFIKSSTSDGWSSCPRI